MPTSSLAGAVGRVLGGRYRLSRPIGSGSSAHVYVAEDVKLGRRVAVKLVHPDHDGDQDFLRRFEQEARTVAGLRHPNIVRVYDSGTDGASGYLVTELLEGGTLRSLLDTGYRLSPAQAVSIGFSLAGALDAARRAGIVHRDIKPANLLFDEAGNVSIADFGLAQVLADTAHTVRGASFEGTTRYAAPEQLRGAAVDGRADVYALALVLAEAVTGKVPGTNEGDPVVGRRLTEPLDPGDDLDGLGPILVAAGAVDPAARDDAAALARRLSRLASRLAAPEGVPVTGIGTLSPSEARVDPTVLPVAAAPGAPPGGVEVVADPVAASGPVVAGGAGVGVSGAAGAGVGAAGPAAGAGGWDVDLRDPPAGGWGPPAGPEPDRSPPQAVPPQAVPPQDAPPRRRRRRWVLVTVVVLVVLALLGAGGGVAWHLTRPTPEVGVPSLRGRSLASARQTLEARHLTMSVTGQYYDPSVPAGSVINQNPTAGLLHEHAVVAVTVSRGPQPVQVPSLAGLSTAEATRLLQVAGLTLGPIRRTTSIHVPAGDVIRATPSTGTLLPGASVRLVVSTGKPVVGVPLLQGAQVQSYAAAAAALSAAHLVPAETQDYSTVVPAGEVITTTPAPGAQVLYGATVTVQVSKGPQMVDVPDVAGDSVAAADQALTGAGLSVTGVRGNPTGTVKRTDPSAGTSVVIGSSVVLITH